MSIRSEQRSLSGLVKFYAKIFFSREQASSIPMSCLISMLQTSSKSINKDFFHSVLFAEGCEFSLPCSPAILRRKEISPCWMGDKAGPNGEGWRSFFHVEVLRLKGSEAWSLLYWVRLGIEERRKSMQDNVTFQKMFKIIQRHLTQVGRQFLLWYRDQCSLWNTQKILTKCTHTG